MLGVGPDSVRPPMWSPFLFRCEVGVGSGIASRQGWEWKNGRSWHKLAQPQVMSERSSLPSHVPVCVWLYAEM